MCDAKMPIEIKGNLYKRTVRLTLLYESECWPLKKSDEQKLHVTKMSLLRWSAEVIFKDKIRNDHIRRSFKVAKICDKVSEGRMRSYGHVMPREKGHITWFFVNIENPKNGHSRPPTT